MGAKFVKQSGVEVCKERVTMKEKKARRVVYAMRDGVEDSQLFDRRHGNRGEAVLVKGVHVLVF